MPGAAEPLDAVLAEARALGFLGPSPIEEHRRHAAAFVAVLRPAARILDLGSGGGLPGLVIAAAHPQSEVVLLDARLARTDFLNRMVARLQWGGRVGVVAARAEVAGRDPSWRGRFDAVVARGFGPPARTAECAAPFLVVGGQLVASEPPDRRRGSERWPPTAVAQLGLRADHPAVRHEVEVHLASFTQATPCPARFPRRRLEPLLWTVGGGGTNSAPCFT